MEERVRTTYAGLIARLADNAYLDPEEAVRARHVVARAPQVFLEQAAHDFVRRLVRTGRLSLRAGAPEDPAAALAAADDRRGQLFRLPEMRGPEPGVLLHTLDPMLAPPARFSPDELWSLVQGVSDRSCAPIDQAMDLKGMLSGMLDLFRRLVPFSTALAFSEGLPLPPGMASGPRVPVFGTGGDWVPAGAEGSPPAILPPAWAQWARQAAETPDCCLHLTDLRRLDAARRPVDSGSALMVALRCDPEERLVLAGVSPQPFWFHEERLARVRVLVPQFRRMLDHAVHLQTLVAHDFLTGAYNRATFEDQLQRSLAAAARAGQAFALLIADIDDFRAINARFGYDAGDAVLRALAEKMRHALRATDVLARYGGEEFAVILSPDVTLAVAQQIGERLRGAVATTTVEVPTLAGAPKALRVTVSIGGSLFPAQGKDRNALWQEANRMLLEAKAAGKNRVRLRAGSDVAGISDI
jgi:diguanylate cyclase (GGDEF)-like protein